MITISEALSYLQRAGFTPPDLLTMAAIGGAESGWNEDAHNTSGEDSRGWLQINVGPGANTDLAGWGLYNPFVCAQAAWTVYQRQGIAAWSTYTSGAYLQFLPQVQAAWEGLQGGGGDLEARVAAIERWIRSYGANPM